MCTCLTQIYLMLEVYIILLLKVQLHVSALNNGHLQVVHDILSKQLYETYMGCIQWGGRGRGGHEISYVSEFGWGGYMPGLCYYILCLR